MGMMSRRKGKVGEREVFGLLSELLGIAVKRNINARQGDCDSLELPGWACESKRVESWTEGYWTQALEQAERVKRRPVLFYRGNRQPWVAMVDLADVCQYEVERGRYRVTMTLEAFAAFVREELSAIEICLRPPALIEVTTAHAIEGELLKRSSAIAGGL
jgi:hypothetical protein